MAKQSALKVRMKMALPMNMSDMASVAEATKAVEAMKETAAKYGFTLVEDVKSEAGSFHFDDVTSGE